MSFFLASPRRTTHENDLFRLTSVRAVRIKAYNDGLL